MVLPIYVHSHLYMYRCMLLNSDEGMSSIMHHWQLITVHTSQLEARAIHVALVVYEWNSSECC